MTEHKLILTGIWPRTSHGQGSHPGWNKGNGLTVRCQCMAGPPGRQVPYAYDFLARVTTLDQAKDIYRQHITTGATVFPDQIEVPR